LDHLLNNRQSNRRRGRGRGPQGNNGRQDNGSRIDNRARGNAPQLLEKYKNLAREAQLQGDRVLTEYYLQFADHYFRIVAENRARFEESRQPRRDEWQGDDGFEGEASEDAQAEHGDNSESAEADRDMRPRRDNRRPNNRERREPPVAREGDEVGAEQGATIDVNILPPALGVSADPVPDLDGEPAPVRKRGRPRRAASDAATEAAE
jgi:hypothetical protein